MGNERDVNGLSVKEIEGAQMEWIKDAQKTPNEKANFKKQKESLGMLDGILVCKGGLENSDLQLEAKFPIILPKEDRFTDIVVQDCHERVHHGGVRSTLWLSYGNNLFVNVKGYTMVFELPYYHEYFRVSVNNATNLFILCVDVNGLHFLFFGCRDFVEMKTN